MILMENDYILAQIVISWLFDPMEWSETTFLTAFVVVGVWVIQASRSVEKENE